MVIVSRERRSGRRRLEAAAGGGGVGGRSRGWGHYGEIKILPKVPMPCTITSPTKKGHTCHSIAEPTHPELYLPQIGL